MRLVHKSASQCDVTQGRIGLQHVLSGQLDSPPDNECMGGVTERAPEGARKMCLTALYERAQIGNQYASGDVTVDMFDHLAYLPGQQPLLAVVLVLRRLRMYLPPQQRSGLQQRAVYRLLVAKLTEGRVQ
jgi:hypothetical protein